jgi:hypothetical protein
MHQSLCSEANLEHHCAKRLTQDGFGSNVQIGFIAAKGRRRSIASWEEYKSHNHDRVTFAGLENGVQAPRTEAIAIFSTFRTLLKDEKVSWCTVKHF